MKPFIIPVFIPNDGCPNKCIYCDQNISVGQQSLPTSEDILNIINAHLKSASLHSKSYRYTQVAFYGGTFTGLPLSAQRKYLQSIAPYIKTNKVHSIRLSTRPDYINQQNLDLLKSFSVKTIELGVQSMDNQVLRQSQRGYTALKVEEASGLVKENGLELGIQLMPGLPGDREDTIMKTSLHVCRIKPDFLRIYPTVVLKNTLLEKLYLNGKYTPMTLNQAVSICKKMLLLFQSFHIPVIRMGIQPTKTLLKPGIIAAGPFHPSFRELVLSSILFDRLYASIKENLTSKTFTFSVHPSELSTFIGNKKENIKRLNKEFPNFEIRFYPDERVKHGKFELSNSLI